MSEVNQGLQAAVEQSSEQIYPHNTENFTRTVEADQKGAIPFLKSNYYYFGGISLLYGLLFAVCLYRNVMSVMFPLLVAGTVFTCSVYLNKFQIVFKKVPFFYAVSAVVLSISFVFTSKTFFGFFTVIGVILLICLFMVQQCYNDREWRFLYYMKNIFSIVVYTFACAAMPFRHFFSFMNQSEKGKYKYLTSILWGLLISIPLVSVILSLLLNADDIFYKILSQTILNFFTVHNILIGAVLFLVGYIGHYCFLCSLSLKNLPEQKAAEGKSIDAVIAITFTGILTLVYILFCGIQVGYLFAGRIGELPMEFTYALYARKGFFELLFVSLINICLVLFCSVKFKNNKVLKALLTIISGCTYILLASSMYRMVLYIREYHLTFLRVLVLWFLGLLAFLLTGLIVFIYNKNFRYFKYSVAVITVFYIILSFGRPDAIIADYNINNYDQLTSEDVRYLMSLSTDAAPAIARIDPDKVIESTDLEFYDYEYRMSMGIKSDMTDYFRRIQADSQDKLVRNYNYSKSKAVQAAGQYLRKN